MAQRLIMPLVRQMMLVGYKNAEYKKHWGYPHYGIDLSSIQGGAGTDPVIYASGDGDVVAVGRDNTLGWGIAVRHLDCISRDGEQRDLILRYMHLTSAAVKVGDTVKAGDVLGVEGKEGTADYHLHLEMDTDTDWPAYSPQVSAGHVFWKKGIDTTVNPSLWLWVGKGQSLAPPTYNPAWLNAEDFNIPELADEAAEKEETAMYMYAPVWVKYVDETPYLYDRNLMQVPSTWVPSVSGDAKPRLSELEPFDPLKNTGLNWWLEDEDGNMVYDFPDDYRKGKPIPYGTEEPGDGAAPDAPQRPQEPQEEIPGDNTAKGFNARMGRALRILEAAFGLAAAEFEKQEG